MKFAIHYIPENDTEHYRASEWSFFEHELQTIEETRDDLSKFVFFVKGKPVNFDQAKIAAAEARSEWQAKREATKKPVWISQGASSAKNTWHKIWIKK